MARYSAFHSRTEVNGSGARQGWRAVSRRFALQLALLSTAFMAAQASAAVHLRIEARPISDPIQAYITVTDDATGNPVGGLTSASFTADLDQSPLTIQASDLTLPPALDPTQKVSVIFVMDYSGSIKNAGLTTMQNAVNTFIDSMAVGDYAAIIKFNNTNPAKASVVAPFATIDDGAHDTALKAVVMDAYPGSGTNLLDAIDLAVQQFSLAAAQLPAGPKSIVVITDGGENSSAATQGTVIADANDISIPVFDIGVGNLNAAREGLLTGLANATGGEFLPAPTNTEITAAYETISARLKNAYLLSIPSSISDCATHTLVITVAGQTDPATGMFSRRDCDMTPDPFSFVSKTNVETATTINADPVTITGIEAPVAISISGGGYSVACTGNYTSAAGSISNGQTLCVRHTSDAAYATDHVTTVTVGGVTGTFTSTTKAAAAAGGGGGGALGLVDLVLALAALGARQRRKA
ncbi:MAG: VWA domain-containing protein [Steroidobacteraceae bacterium]